MGMVTYIEAQKIIQELSDKTTNEAVRKRFDDILRLSAGEFKTFIMANLPISAWELEGFIKWANDDAEDMELQGEQAKGDDFER